jgi:predicted aspartyl protease
LSIIAELNLKWKRRGRAILGDGSECVFNVYEAVVDWDDTLLTIPVDEADSDPLVGMSLMEGYELKMQVFEGGYVKLRKVNTVESGRGEVFPLPSHTTHHAGPQWAVHEDAQTKLTD